MFDLHVIGAGPTGSVAALAAARKGQKVLMSEEHLRAGEPMHCSGLFSKSGLESLKDFFDYRKLIRNDIYGAIIDFSGEQIEIKTKNPIAYVCDRAALDATVAANAEKEGVKVEYGKRITNNYAAQNIIGADGPFSQVATNFAFPKISQYVSTVQAYIKYKSETPKQVEVFLSNEKFPEFFAWIIPHDEELAEFGVGVALPNNVGKAWRTLLRMKGIDYASQVKGAVIPISVRKKTAKRIGKRNVLLVGDAAGQTKATTGGGVIIGSNCARFAGIHCNSPLRYELEWNLRFGLDLFTHRKVHDYLAGKSNVQLQSLGRKIKQMELDRFLSNNGHMDRPTKMIKPQIIPHLLRGF
ncbi:NAD(P)/FAD-dependent oxidoreductase [Candidatus Micrarchaeota archaeon]|nr:hypothetical protein [uncultured archaeon]MBS3068525.1 NAD(P)/FAD-dependent oxidoreductase [Candidatus Micrarchaeota archaeon]